MVFLTLQIYTYHIFQHSLFFHNNSTSTKSDFLKVSHNQLYVR